MKPQQLGRRVWHTVARPAVPIAFTALTACAVGAQHLFPHAAHAIAQGVTYAGVLVWITLIGAIASMWSSETSVRQDSPAE
ncbi:hypothetical protein QZM81_19455 [Burkholderia cepacia]|uniref:hypothetical protein n=1 Tax=Burkholderia cepacia TaxID=292 RepID=UPI0026557EB6|nr:hypothetical protein [Burkholderia cepacia]MDN7857984.1 hypothetical protein [Burkholderia cepacia]